MKKSLSLLLAASLVFGAFGSVASAAEMTAQEKFDALAAKGIFAGINDAGDAGLDQKMNRAQFARVAALILGLEGVGTPDTKVVTAKPFDDVAVNAWFAEEVTAVKEAGLMVGNGDGTFKPVADISVQELSVVVAGLLGLEKVEGATVEGAADWAAPYIKAIQDANVPFPTNYKEAATRSVLVEAAYVADAKLNAEVLTATTTVSSAKAFKVTFNKAVDSTKVTAAVTKNGTAVALTSAWNDAKTELTLSRTINLEAGEYVVTVSGAELANPATTLTVTPERIQTIELDSAAYRKADATKAEVTFKLINQYGEDITKNFVASDIVPTSSVGGTPVVEVTNGKANGTLTLSGLTTDTKEVTVSVVDKKFAMSAVKTVAVKDQKQVEEIALVELEKKTDKTVIEAGVANYNLKYTAKDQYGNDIKVTDLSKLTFVSSDATVIDPAAANAIEVADGKISVDIKAFNGPKEVKLTSIVNRSGKQSQITIAINGAAKAAEPTLVLPTTRFSGNTYKVELQVKDQYGNAMKADDIVAAYGATPSEFTVVSGNTSIFTAGAVTKDGEKAIVTLTRVGEGTANLTVTVNATGKSSVQPITVVAVAVPTSLTLETSVTQAVYGADLTVKPKFKDQYGEAIDTHGNAVTFETSDATVFAAPADSTVTLVKDGVTFTALKDNASATITVNLENAGGDVIDARTVSLTAVKNDIALTYEVEALGTVATYAAGSLASDYAKEVKVVGKDSAGNLVALKSDAIFEVTSSDTDVLDVGLNGGKWKVAGDGTEDADAFANVVITTPNGGVKTIAAPVKVSKVAPAAVSIAIKTGDDKVEKVTVDNGDAIANFFDSAEEFYVEVTDQYGETSALSTTASVSVFVKDTTGAVTKQTTYTFGTNGEYTITAVIGDKSATIKVTVE